MEFIVSDLRVDSGVFECAICGVEYFGSYVVLLDRVVVTCSMTFDPCRTIDVRVVSAIELALTALYFENL